MACLNTQGDMVSALERL